MDNKILQITSDEFLSLLKENYKEQLNWLDIAPEPQESFKAEGVFMLCADVESFLSGPVPQLVPHANKFHLIRLLVSFTELQNPFDFLQKIKTYLRANGLVSLFISDDSIPESSHPFSYWISILESEGFHCFFRRENEKWRFLLSCRPSEEWETVQKNFLAKNFAVIKEKVQTGERIYFEFLKELSDGCQFYLLNPSVSPYRLLIQCRTAAESHPDLFLGDLKLHYIRSQREEQHFLHSWETLALAPGGHRLSIRYPEIIEPLELFSIHCEKLENQGFLKELPFDHYQRYQLIANIAEGIFPDSISVLDVGGSLGYLSLFLPAHQVTVTDVTSQDIPCAQVYDGQCLPFETDSFDLVTAIDTLEHIPHTHREQFLAEMARVSRTMVIVCGPFYDPLVIESERIVQDFLTLCLHKSDHFLDEHQDYGLPVKKEITEFLGNQDFSLYEIPNGFLPRWTGMQLASFTMNLFPEMKDGRCRLNTIYNNQPIEKDNCEPAYRYAIVAKKGLYTDDEESVLESMFSSSGKDEIRTPWDLASLVVTLSNSRIIQEKDAVLAQFSDRINRLLDHCHNLELSQQEELHEREKLLHHADNLQKQVERFSSLFENQQQDAKNYQSLCSELQKKSSDLLKQKETLLQNNADLVRHAENLNHLIQSHQDTIQNMTDSIGHFQSALAEKDKHAQNLDGLLSSMQQHAVNLEHLYVEKKMHAQNLEAILHEKEKHIQNLENLRSQKDMDYSQKENWFQERINNAEEILGKYNYSQENLLKLFHLINEAKDSSTVDMPSFDSILPNETDTITTQIQTGMIDLFLENFRLNKRVKRLHESLLFRLLMKLRLIPGHNVT